MMALDLWFPEDFDKRYAGYQAEHKESKMPGPFLLDRLENERKHILAISNEEDFKHEIDKWHPLKIIVDAIYKELSPFLPSDTQVIKIELSKLGLSEKQAGHIFLMLAYERVCRWQISKETVVMTSEPLRQYMVGNGVVVPDYEKFQELRNKINDFLRFMENHKKWKFPIKSSPDAKSKALRKKIEEAGKNEGEIDTTIKKRVAVWGGETVSDLPLINYNEATGKGEVMGKKKFRFKDGSSEYKVFRMLYAKLGKKTAKLERFDVLVAGEFYQDHETPDPARRTNETAFINDIAKNIREKTGLNIDELVNNNGSLTLLALKQGKNPPKVTKFVPVWG